MLWDNSPGEGGEIPPEGSEQKGHLLKSMQVIHVHTQTPTTTDAAIYSAVDGAAAAGRLTKQQKRTNKSFMFAAAVSKLQDGLL